jgi:hypothetical protein
MIMFRRKSTRIVLAPALASVGPYSGGFTSRISKISAAGGRTTVVDGLPSSQTQPMPVSLVSGVSALAFLDGALYVSNFSFGAPAGAGQILRITVPGD